jgi:hypothetical protein
MRDHESLSDRARAAADLRDAEAKIERHLPESREKYFVLRNIREAIVSLDGGHVLCRRCGQPFVFDARHFRDKGLAPPRHCHPCRRARAAERGLL